MAYSYTCYVFYICCRIVLILNTLITVEQLEMYLSGLHMAYDVLIYNISVKLSRPIVVHDAASRKKATRAMVEICIFFPVQVYTYMYLWKAKLTRRPTIGNFEMADLPILTSHTV